MASPARIPHPDPIDFEESEPMSQDDEELVPEWSTVHASGKPATTGSPTESEIAAVAYLLWLDNGCPEGTAQDDWFRAEAMLKAALAARQDEPSRRPSSPWSDVGSEYEILAQLRWEGHWEVWESEWGGARWVSAAGSSD